MIPDNLPGYPDALARDLPFVPDTNLYIETTLIPSRLSTAHPHPAPVEAPMDLIFIEGFTGETVIGIHDSELHRPQPW